MDSSFLTLLSESLSRLEENDKIQREDMKDLTEKVHEATNQVHNMASYVLKINDLAGDLKNVTATFSEENKEMLTKIAELRGSEKTILNLLSVQKEQLDRVDSDFKNLKSSNEIKLREQDDKLNLFNSALTDLNNKTAVTAWKTFKYILLSLIITGLSGGLSFLIIKITT